MISESSPSTRQTSAALRCAPADRDGLPVDARLVPVAEYSDAQVSVLISGEGFGQEISIRVAPVRPCIDAEGKDETQRGG
ncbi:hypothetical protein ACWKWP_02795 [Agromyces soli]